MSSSILCVFVVLLIHTCTLPCEAASHLTVCTNGGTECSALANSVCDIETFICQCAYYSNSNSYGCAAIACVADTTCIAVDPNSDCSGAVSGTDTCKCKTGYSLLSTDRKCYRSVTSTTCTVAGKECDAITHARCDSTTLKCKCGGIANMNANTCSGKTCVASTTCTALDANSECSGTLATSTCQCRTGYLMGKDGICTLKCLSDAVCIAADANSACSGTTSDDKCNCKTGYTHGTNGKCASGAAAVLASMTMMFACFLATLV